MASAEGCLSSMVTTWALRRSRSASGDWAERDTPKGSSVTNDKAQARATKFQFWDAMLIQNPPRAGSTGNAGKYRRRVPEWEEYAHTPAVFVRAANKGLKCYVNWESAQRKETEGLLRRV